MRELKITHLFPELLNLYGDKGNIASLKCRAEWRGISASVNEICLGDEIGFEDTDILFLGGGSEKELKTVLDSLMPVKNQLSDYVQNGGVLFSVCEGFTLLGEIVEIDGKEEIGLGILEISSKNFPERFIGDVAEEVSLDGEKFIVTGFENRGFVVNIKNEIPFGKIITGNGEFDGVIKNNVLASCLHGPLLPKNPKLCDILIKKALIKKYGELGDFPTLDDDMENEASRVMENRLLNPRL